MIPLTTRDAADWSMICAYLRLDDEGRKRVIEEIEYQTSRMMKEQPRKKKVCSLCAHCIQNPHVRDKRHRPEDAQVQYLCVRRGEELAFETGHGNTCRYWKERP